MFLFSIATYLHSLLFVNVNRFKKQFQITYYEIAMYAVFYHVFNVISVNANVFIEYFLKYS